MHLYRTAGQRITHASGYSFRVSTPTSLRVGISLRVGRTHFAWKNGRCKRLIYKHESTTTVLVGFSQCGRNCQSRSSPFYRVTAIARSSYRWGVSETYALCGPRSKITTFRLPSNRDLRVASFSPMYVSDARLPVNTFYVKQMPLRRSLAACSFPLMHSSGFASMMMFVLPISAARETGNRDIKSTKKAPRARSFHVDGVLLMP